MRPMPEAFAIRRFSPMLGDPPVTRRGTLVALAPLGNDRSRGRGDPGQFVRIRPGFERRLPSVATSCSANDARQLTPQERHATVAPVNCQRPWGPLVWRPYVAN